VALIKQEAVLAVCSFCLRPNTEVETLVAGPGVFICNDCVDLCDQVITGKPKSVPRVAPWEQETTLEGILSNLPRIATAGAQVEQNLVEWVRRARSNGATWAQVGEALGMTRQSAWERFSGEE
jgi:hypothetical protein